MVGVAPRVPGYQRAVFIVFVADGIWAGGFRGEPVVIVIAVDGSYIVKTLAEIRFFY